MRASRTLAIAPEIPMNKKPIILAAVALLSLAACPAFADGAPGTWEVYSARTTSTRSPTTARWV
jgi:hypothetical protein